MSRKSILAIAAVAALGTSTLVATEASARFGGGGFSGGHAASVGHVGGMSRGGNFSRAAFHPARVNAGRVIGRTFHPGRVSGIKRAVIRPPIYVLHHPHHHHWWWTWCRFHHHYRCGGYPWVDVGGVDAAPAVLDAPQAVAATPVAATCTNDCDYFLNNEPGCYMAKRAFSTPQGEELRCVKICDPPEADETAK